MNALYETIPTGDFKQNPAAAFKRTESGPVVVMNRARPAVVMVSPEEWNRTAKRLAELEMFFEAAEINERVEHGEEETVSFSELCDRLGVDPHEMAKGGKS